MARFREVVGQVGIYSFASVLTQMISVLGALLIRWFLGPLQTGVWSLIQVILSYTDYANLGATYSIPIEIPFKKAQGKLAEVEQMKNVIFSFSFLTSLLFALGALVYAFVRHHQIPNELFYGLLITAGLVILQQLNNILISLLRADKNFKFAGKQMILSSLVNLILITGFSSMFRLYGFMYAMCLSFIFNILYIFFHQPFRFQWVLDFKILKGLIQYGFPLMILTFAGTILATIDKMMIAKYLGFEALGLYSIAVMTSGFIFSFPNSIGIVLIPNISEKYAQSESIHDLAGYLTKSNHIFSVLMPVLIGFSWFVVPVMVHLLIPKFLTGITAMKYLAISAFFIGLSQPYNNFIIVSKKHLVQLPMTLGMCGFAFAFIFLIIRAGGGINEVAIAMTIVMMCNFTILFFYVCHYLFTGKELFREYCIVLINFLIMTSALLFLDQRFNSSPFFARMLFQMIGLMIIYLPFLIHLNKKYQFGNILMEKFSRPKSMNGVK
ncbi:MAG: hypothetical protein A3G33_03175 [Omnitrophica bacterium RIFCSPLOWO2_12_FULL_44_17]|uniref:Polysaccharide biosynthesis protein C-terminal domain-containing protein n=1 Tax=Candidatus Danuiimicrobium aquiferis TaxID=1801832 RepID=A0A1G1KTS2_9BACT|nr:MAG: hypothetical protein A3B72_06720 [Omnitrophica bacterium RIFCSPHIGHO2_02_FULL_45_28]OGW92209.1 MAG: hypothetical protein A3E74_03945 [Omnitrophica bacterium RIFCSPHIGHO2_12_FULL_44_12]OGW96321.1 MAG: hypothetical protein A3G33_03175 [Omnitrophica bacterium RIFCSPLOWO2_12_FULL_44_17]